MKKQIHVFYSGNVQGVGFRFIAQTSARGLGITGWVKNIDHGRVEVIAESEEKTLELFLERVGNEFSRYINNVDVKWLPSTGEFKDFRIEF